jgi:tRNA (mo5U34)-methyltransferase
MVEDWLRATKNAQNDRNQETAQDEMPFRGYEQDKNQAKFVDLLSDADLIELNRLLKWNCFTVDSHGRRFGNKAWKGKRERPEIIPDDRILLTNERFELSDKQVLEIGCFEGIHTIALSMYARKVTAIDARIENVVKTIVRCAMFGYHPTVFKCNVEERPVPFELLQADVGLHIGVLYHLKDPVQHLLELRKFLRLGLVLDTHYALDEEPSETYEVNGRPYNYKKQREKGYSSFFSGMYEHSKWLRLEDIVELLRAAGFGQVEIVEIRKERNGPRALLIARSS